jgi:predicted metal-dependent HD superfamily phosphohydrolase
VATSEEALRDAWRQVAGPHRTAALERLLGRYREPHRRYHTVDHVATVLNALQEITHHSSPEAVPRDPEAVVLAVLFHDVVYDPAAMGNEEASAVLAGRCADELGWAPYRCGHVERLVMATAGHTADDPDSAALIDADLAVLAAEPSAYTAYALAVREEYQHVGDEHWAAGRAAVLRGFLAREHVFCTDYMRVHADQRARANMAAELATLSKP